MVNQLLMFTSAMLGCYIDIAPDPSTPAHAPRPPPAAADIRTGPSPLFLRSSRFHRVVRVLAIVPPSSVLAFILLVNLSDRGGRACGSGPAVNMTAPSRRRRPWSRASAQPTATRADRASATLELAPPAAAATPWPLAVVGFVVVHHFPSPLAALARPSPDHPRPANFVTVYISRRYGLQLRGASAAAKL